MSPAPADSVGVQIIEPVDIGPFGKDGNHGWAFSPKRGLALIVEGKFSSGMIPTTQLNGPFS